MSVRRRWLVAAASFARDALKGAPVRVDMCDSMWRIKKSFTAK